MTVLKQPETKPGSGENYLTHREIQRVHLLSYQSKVSQREILVEGIFVSPSLFHCDFFLSWYVTWIFQKIHLDLYRQCKIYKTRNDSEFLNVITIIARLVRLLSPLIAQRQQMRVATSRLSDVVLRSFLYPGRRGLLKWTGWKVKAGTFMNTKLS